MEIREGSWHYWLYEMSYSQHRMPAQNTNLCKYFWRVVGGAIWTTFIAAVIGIVLGAIGFLFYKYTLFTVTAVAVAAAIVWVSVLCVYVSERLDLRAYRKRSQPGYQEPEPSLLRAYLRAKKEKVCPLITVVKADEKEVR